MKFFNENCLSKENCNIIRGIVAIVIILHHSAFYVSYGRILDFLLKNIGASMTTIFFFYSGYGLMLSLNKKSDYMTHFIRKRLLTIVIPYIVTNFVYIIVSELYGNHISLLNALKSFVKGNTLVPYSWYVVVIFFLYLAFYLSFRWLDIKKGTIVCIVLNIAYIVAAFLAGFEEYWYNTAFAFSFGILFYINCEKIFALFKKRDIIKFICLVLTFGVLLVLGKLIHNGVLLIIIKSMRSVVFCMIMLLLSMLLCGHTNKVLELLGNISYELYLYQGVAFLILRDTWFRRQSIVFAVAVLAITFIFAYVFGRLDKFIVKKIC